jgi:hypothetical protein
MEQRPQDRRHYGRVHLTPPLPGSVDTTRVSIVEVSLVGARMVQEGRITTAGVHRLRFEWDLRPIDYSCEVVRTTVVRLARNAGETTVYETGVRLTAPRDDSATALRELISEHVVHAINEQIANAHGIPPLAVYSYQTEKGGRYRRCEYSKGQWRRSDTTIPDQPENGFTISAEVDPYFIEMLCRTYDACDAKGRELTKLFAQLSIDRKEGIPTRRFLP